MKAARAGAPGRSEFAMPRKIRCTVFVVVLSLLCGLVGQAAAALPLGPRLAFSDTSSGDFFAAFWDWLAERWGSFGQAVATQTPVVTGAREKTSSNGDPNGRALCDRTP
jgi:hypothetical protein